MIVEKFEKRVKENPTKIAIKVFNNEITYQMLNDQANVLARRIIADFSTIKLVKNEKSAALLFEHGIDMIISTIGALKAETIYVPLDPSYPISRLAFMIMHSEVNIIITNNNNLELANFMKKQYQLNIKIVNTDEIDGKYSFENLDRKILVDDIAYILYTSGSTGNPKGIIQTHKNILHFIECYKNTLMITEEDKMTLFSSFSHDAAIMDIYGALLNGATLYPLNIKMHLGIDEITNLLIKEKITIWHSVPTVYRYFINELKGKEKFNMLRFIVLGGENVILHDIEMFQKTFTNTKLVNLYGQTESSFNSAQLYSIDSKVKKVTLGKPVQDCEILVIDENMEEVTPLNIGEIVILSDYVALGYWKDEEKTKESFRYNPILGKMYLSGDLGKLLPDGSIDFIGRKDSQVKIRGYRVEIEEIENHLLKYETIFEVAVLGKRDTSGDDYLCAYVISNERLNPNDLRVFLSERLPEYMIPSYFIQIEQMPVTPNNKIDKKLLPDPEETTIKVKEFEIPKSETEKKIASIWREVLKMDDFGINDNFFELGGHSLKITGLISKIHKELNVNVPFREVFKLPTIKELSDFIESKKKRMFTEMNIIEEKDYYEASSAQQRMFLLQQFDLKSMRYNMLKIITIEGTLDINRLIEAYHTLVKRHETLRTSFDLIDDQVVQRVHKDIDFEVPYYEIEEDGIENKVKEFVSFFDLSKAPLMRVELIKLSENKHLLLFDMHHIISDGISMGIIWEELFKLYKGEELEPLRIQYKDFSAWQNEQLKSDVMKKQEAYWLEVFREEIPVLSVPTDYARPILSSFEGDTVNFKIEKNSYLKLKSLMIETNSTMYMLLLAIYNVLLSKYSGQEDIIIGSPIAGRRHEDLSNIIGMFVNTLAMRNRPKGDETFKNFLLEVRENALQGYENQDYQFEELVEKLNIPRDMSRNPIFDTMFVLQNMDRSELDIQYLNFKRYGVYNKTTKFDITLYAMEEEEEIYLGIEYATKLFKKETIERMVDHFLKIVSEIVENYDIQLSKINMLTDEERNQILYEFNDTKVDYPKDKTIHQLFEEQVEKTPNNVAVVFEDKSMTYRELNEKSNQIARLLRTKGVKADTIVGIMIERSIEMIIGILGILKAGGAYLPIDPNYPRVRINHMFKDSNIDILLTQSWLRKEIEFTGEILTLDDNSLYLDDYENVSNTCKPNNLAYIIYTSGSTGMPKGVMVEHKAICNTLQGRRREYDFCENDSILILFSFAFDGFITNFFSTVINGAKAILIKEESKNDPVVISNLIEKYRITNFISIPSFLKLILDCDNKKLDSLKSITMAGEKITDDIVSTAKGKIDNRIKLINEYGPTENSVMTTISHDVSAGKITIGKPIANTQVYILSQKSNLQPIGVVGELCISGDGLARGYLNREELTAEKFVDNPFNLGKRMYKTGDLARWLSDGNIEYLGRIDNQVKIRGFRIELDEIKSKLLQHEAVKEAVTTVIECKDGDKYICAYISSSKDIDKLSLKEFLRETLPEYMIPTYFVKIDKMPITPNGKLDREALPNPQFEARLTGYEAPRNDIENALAQIWSGVLDIDIDKIGINDNFFELGGHSLKAAILAGKIFKEFGTVMPLNVIFKIPTIKDLSKCILNSEAYNKFVNYTENQIVIKLNKMYKKNIFLFPPTLGYGIVYSEFAKYIDMHTVYSFDFIEDENRIDNYVSIINNIQKEGEIALIGYSAGGNLAFEVAKELEIRGKDVKNIILLDTDLRDEKMSVTPNDFSVFDQAIENINSYFNIPFMEQQVRESVQKKLEAFIPYWNELVNNGKTNASIHYILCYNKKNDEEIVSKKMERVGKWSNLTKKNFKVHQGYGYHGEMIDGEYVKLNAQIINKILN